MGFFEKAAAKTELKVRNSVIDLVHQLRPDFDVGPMLMPCHLESEVHNGLYVDTGHYQLVAYRCSGHWWGREVSADELRQLKSDDPFAFIAALEGHRGELPFDLGAIQGGLESIAAGLAFGLPERDPGALATVRNSQNEAEKAEEYEGFESDADLDSVDFSGFMDFDGGSHEDEYDVEFMLARVREQVDEILPRLKTEPEYLDGEPDGFSFRIAETVHGRMVWRSVKGLPESSAGYRIYLFVNDDRVGERIAESGPIALELAVGFLLGSVLDELVEALSGAHTHWGTIGATLDAMYPSLSRGQALTALEDEVHFVAELLVRYSREASEGDNDKFLEIMESNFHAFETYLIVVSTLPESLQDLRTTLETIEAGW